MAVASVGDSGLSRITLVAPRTRIDLAVPSDVPVADLLPTLLHYADDSVSASAAPEGWALSRLGGMALDSSRTPAQLEVRDGELLYLRPRGGEAPMLVFDDVVDAVATATTERAGRWSPAATRVFGLGFGVFALLGGVILLLFTGPPQTASGLIGLSMAVALLATAVILARAVGDSGAGVVVGVMAMVYAATGGLLVSAGDRKLSDLAPAHALVAVTAVLIVAVIAALGVADSAQIFLGTGLTAAAIELIAVIILVFDVSVPAAAAVVATLTFSTLPAMPMLSYRLAGLPIPTVPLEPEELKRDTENVDGARVLQRTDRADALLTGMLGALAAIGAGAAIATSTSGYAGIALCAVLGLLLMARARLFLSRAQRLCLLWAGTAALAACSIAVFGLVSQTMKLTAILGGIVLIAAISVAFGLAKPGKRRSPVWGRLLDILEVMLILALIPLAAWVCGLYAWIRGIRG